MDSQTLEPTPPNLSSPQHRWPKPAPASFPFPKPQCPFLRITPSVTLWDCQNHSASPHFHMYFLHQYDHPLIYLPHKNLAPPLANFPLSIVPESHPTPHPPPEKECDAPYFEHSSSLLCGTARPKFAHYLRTWLSNPIFFPPLWSQQDGGESSNSLRAIFISSTRAPRFLSWPLGEPWLPTGHTPPHSRYLPYLAPSVRVPSPHRT